MNATSLEDFLPLFEEFFQIDFPEEYLYLKNTPDFKKIHVDHLKTPRQLGKLKNFCDESNNSYCNLILGLYEEFGILTSSPNYQKAFSYYEKGAQANEPYCIYRMFFIYQNELEKFALPPNPTLQFSLLLKAAAFFDEKDNRFSDKVLDPILHLAVFYEADKEKLEKLIEIYTETLNLTDQFTSDFLRNWFNIKFPNTEEIKKNSIEKQKILSVSQPEAAYHIGDNHRWGGETLEKDSGKAEKFLILAANQNLYKAIESIAIIYIEEGDYDKAIFWLEKGAALGSYLCIKFLGEYEISGKILKKNIDQGLKKLKKAFYLGDFWAAWTIIIVYKYIKNLPLDIKNKKVYKYSNVLFSAKDIMGNIVYITIRHSSLASCYEKSICLPKDLKIALDLHLDCLSEIKRECWKGYTYYKVGKLYEKMNNKPKANEFYFKGFRARADFIKKEHKKEPPHYYNYAKMFEFGRGVAKNLILAQKYYKLGAAFNSFLSFHLVYGDKCKNRLKIIDKELKQTQYIVDFAPISKNLFALKRSIPIIPSKQFVKEKKLDCEFDSNIELYNGFYPTSSTEKNQSFDQKLTKSVLIYKYSNLSFENYWMLIRNIFVLEKYQNLLSKYPKIIGVNYNNKSREIMFICDNEPKFTVLNNLLKSPKIPYEFRTKIVTSILSLNYKSFIHENEQLLCKNLDLCSFLISEKDYFHIQFNLPLLLNGEVEKNDENKLINDLFKLVEEILEIKSGNNAKIINEILNPVLKNFYYMIKNNDKNWKFDDLLAQLNLNQKSSTKSKFFNF